MRSAHLVCALSATLLAVAGCGGGGENVTASDATPVALANAATAAVSPSVSTAPVEQRSRALAVAASSTSASASDSLSYSFDAEFWGIAPGWWLNWWGSAYPGFEASRETGASNVASGSASQRFKLNSVASDGDAHLVYTYAFAKDKKYTITLQAKADAVTKVRFQFRLQGYPYTEVTSKIVDLTSSWQTVTIEGTYLWSEPGTVRVIPLTHGTNVYLDEMSIAQTATEAETASDIVLPAQGSAAISLTPVLSSTMEAAFSRFADGWFFNAWSGASESGFVASRETRAAYVHSGAASQKFQLFNKNGGEVHLIAGHNFVKGKTYNVSMWVRSDQSLPIWAGLRMDAPPWQPVAATQVTIGTAWQKIELEGVYSTDASGTVRLAILNPTGTLWVDDLTISEVNRNDLAPASAATVPDTMFGMHVNKLGQHAKWPGLGTKIVRLWDSGVTWRELKPTAAGSWDFTRNAGLRLDMYVQYVRANDSTADIIYTLGQTPQWASTTPTSAGIYGPGANGAPKDMNDWRDYVRTLARRYVGKIRYWELWNEPDYAPMYSGGWASMVEMARVAREELLAADPNNRLVGPGFTPDQGMNGLEAFLTAGGGQYIDIVGYHWYYATNPEALSASIDNVRYVMKAHNVGDKPLWNTEGAFICNPAVANCATAKPTAVESRSVNARALFLMANKGIQNFNFYFWETDEAFAQLVSTDLNTPTIAATALTHARTWLKGAGFVDAYRIDDKVYVFRLKRGTENFVVLWAMNANTMVQLPAEWSARTVHTLSGTQTLLTSNRLALGPEPVMLKQ